MKLEPGMRIKSKQGTGTIATVGDTTFEAEHEGIAGRWAYVTDSDDWEPIIERAWAAPKPIADLTRLIAALRSVADELENL